MAMTRAMIQAALVQQWETDRLLGARSVPVPAGAATFTLGGGAGGASRRAPAVARIERASGSPAEVLAALDGRYVKGCVECGLCRTRKQTVFGAGSASARLVFVGEAPGFEEDRQGLPFVGRAGELLTKMIEAMGLSRDEVFICNVLKCRPPNNRDPGADEISACSPYLFEQLSIIRPEVVVALGAPSARTLLNTEESIGRLRGRFHDFSPPGGVVGASGGGGDDAWPIPLMPTYHPAYLLRSPGEKGKAWSDLKLVMGRLGLSIPGGG